MTQSVGATHVSAHTRQTRRLSSVAVMTRVSCILLLAFVLLASGAGGVDAASGSRSAAAASARLRTDTGRTSVAHHAHHASPRAHARAVVATTATSTSTSAATTSVTTSASTTATSSSSSVTIDVGALLAGFANATSRSTDAHSTAANGRAMNIMRASNSKAVSSKLASLQSAASRSVALPNAHTLATAVCSSSSITLTLPGIGCFVFNPKYNAYVYDYTYASGYITNGTTFVVDATVPTTATVTIAVSGATFGDLSAASESSTTATVHQSLTATVVQGECISILVTVGSNDGSCTAVTYNITCSDNNPGAPFTYSSSSTGATEDVASSTGVFVDPASSTGGDDPASSSSGTDFEASSTGLDYFDPSSTGNDFDVSTGTDFDDASTGSDFATGSDDPDASTGSEVSSTASDSASSSSSSSTASSAASSTAAASTSTAAASTSTAGAATSTAGVSTSTGGASSTASGRSSSSTGASSTARSSTGGSSSSASSTGGAKASSTGARSSTGGSSSSSTASSSSSTGSSSIEEVCYTYPTTCLATFIPLETQQSATLALASTLIQSVQNKAGATVIASNFAAFELGLVNVSIAYLEYQVLCGASVSSYSTAVAALDTAAAAVQSAVSTIIPALATTNLASATNTLSTAVQNEVIAAVGVARASDNYTCSEATAAYAETASEYNIPSLRAALTAAIIANVSSSAILAAEVPYADALLATGLANIARVLACPCSTGGGDGLLTGAATRSEMSVMHTLLMAIVAALAIKAINHLA